MSVKLNTPGLTHARQLISEGKVDKTSDWSFSADDGNAMMGPDGKDYKSYGLMHLGEQGEANENTKAQFEYPYGKGAKVYRSALTAIRQRAGQQNEKDIFDAAGKLLEEIDGKQTEKAKSNIEAEEFFVASAEISDGTNLPTRIPLLPLGTWKGVLDPVTHKKKTVTITPADVDQAIATFHAAKKINPTLDLVIDNDHRTLTDEYAPAFGWMKDFVKGQNGWLYAIVDWTKLGTEAVANKLYRYISPVFFRNGVDRKTGETIPFGIAHAGLVNDPLFSELELTAGKKIYQLTLEGDTEMNKVIAKLRETFKLAESATEDDVLAKLTAHLGEHATVVAAKNDLYTILGLKPESTVAEAKTTATQVVAAKAKIFEALGLKPESTIEEAAAIVVTAKGNQGNVIQLAQEVQELKAKETTREYERVIAKAFQEGRILPAQKADAQWASTQKDFAAKAGIPAFEQFWAKQPVVGPVQQTPETKTTNDGGELNEMDVTVAKNLGISVAEMKKAKGTVAA